MVLNTTALLYEIKWYTEAGQEEEEEVLYLFRSYSMYVHFLIFHQKCAYIIIII